MLISENRRKDDENKPNDDRHATGSAGVTDVNVSQNQHQRGVERRKQIEGRIHSAKPIENRAEPTAGMRTRKCEPEREKQKTNSGGDDGGGDSFAKSVQLTI